MSESLPLLCETAERLFSDIAAREADAAWDDIEAAGFPLLLAAEADGGFGGDWEDAFAVLRIAGLHATADQLASAIAATWITRVSGLPHAEGRTLLAQGAEGKLTHGRFTGVVKGVDWSSAAASVLVSSVPGQVVRLKIADADVEVGANPAGEQRAKLQFENAAVETGSRPADVSLWAALARTAQIAGALDAALALSIAYANERTQFGRPIGKFQAVQQSLAEFAEEAAAVNCAGRAAARAADMGDADMEIAAAKLRAGQAAAVGARVAHQVHGAIGFTQEHALQRYTTRLASWRSEFGNEMYWSLRLGQWAAKQGADGLWPALTQRSDAQNAR